MAVMGTPAMEMTLETFLRQMHGATSPAVAPRDAASDASVRDGISRQWRPTPGDMTPPF